MAAEAAAWFHDNLLKKDLAEPAREYLKNRGIDRTVATKLEPPVAPQAIAPVATSPW